MDKSEIVDNYQRTFGQAMDNSSVLPAKNKGGRPRGSGVSTTKTYKVTGEINLQQILDSTVNWRRVIRILWKEALGGYKYTNGNGVEVIAKPDLDTLKWLIDNRFGKAAARDLTTGEQMDAIKKLSKLTDLFLPKGNHVVSADGALVDTKQSTALN